MISIRIYCVNGTGVDEEDWVGEENRKKALVIIYKKHPPFFTCNQLISIKKKNLTSVRAITESDDL